MGTRRRTEVIKVMKKYFKRNSSRNLPEEEFQCNHGHGRKKSTADVKPEATPRDGLGSKLRRKLSSNSMKTPKKDKNAFVVADDKVEEYNPEEQEIIAYAKYIGMDPADAVDSQLMWVAEQGLKAPLPEEWKACTTGDEKVFYYNEGTGESVWEHPCDEFYKMMFVTEKKNLVKRMNIDKEKEEQKQKFLEQRRLEEEERALQDKREAAAAASTSDSDLETVDISERANTISEKPESPRELAPPPQFPTLAAPKSLDEYTPVKKSNEERHQEMKVQMKDDLNTGLASLSGKNLKSIAKKTHKEYAYEPEESD
eukprot:GFYU01005631.1.p1 GENE.GFYU01005631.1~~GFYU01005631.1.p1  ORF type:complete len:312 (-),score=78.53 GFYU01005631.1:112-1047(-)